MSDCRPNQQRNSALKGLAQWVSPFSLVLNHVSPIPLRKCGRLLSRKVFTQTLHPGLIRVFNIVLQAIGRMRTPIDAGYRRLFLLITFSRPPLVQILSYRKAIFPNPICKFLSIRILAGRCKQVDKLFPAHARLPHRQCGDWMIFSTLLCKSVNFTNLSPAIIFIAES